MIAPTCRAKDRTPHPIDLRLRHDISAFASAAGSAVMSTIRPTTVLNLGTLTGVANSSQSQCCYSRKS